MKVFSCQVLIVGVFVCDGIWGQLDSPLPESDYTPDPEEEDDAEVKDNKLLDPELPEMGNTLTSQNSSILKHIQNGSGNCDEVENTRNADTRASFVSLNLIQAKLQEALSREHRSLMEHNTNLANTLESKMTNYSESYSRLSEGDRIQISRIELKLTKVQESLQQFYERIDCALNSSKDTEDLPNVSSMELKNTMNESRNVVLEKLHSLTVAVTQGNSELSESHDRILAKLESSRLKNSSYPIQNEIQTCTKNVDRINLELEKLDLKNEGIHLTLNSTVIKNQKAILTKLESMSGNLNKDGTESNLELINQMKALESKLKVLEENLNNCGDSQQLTQQKLQNLENKLTFQIMSSKVESKNQYENLNRNMKFGLETLSQQYHKVYEEARELKSNLTRTAATASTRQESTPKHVEVQNCPRSCKECKRNCATERHCREPWVCSGCEMKCDSTEETHTSKNSSSESNLRPNASPKTPFTPQPYRRNYNNNHNFQRHDSRSRSHSRSNPVTRNPTHWS